MPLTSSELADELATALEGLRADRLDSIDALEPLYDRDVEFRDPIQQLRGVDAFMEMNRRLIGRCREIAFTPTSVASRGDNIFLAWSMAARPRVGPRIAVEGVTHARALGGRVVVHRDFWDLGELVTSPVPFAQTALRWLLKPIA
jgi:hypothetical protein